jgi:hypothetical protein
VCNGKLSNPRPERCHRSLGDGKTMCVCVCLHKCRTDKTQTLIGHGAVSIMRNVNYRLTADEHL